MAKANGNKATDAGNDEPRELSEYDTTGRPCYHWTLALGPIMKEVNGVMTPHARKCFRACAQNINDRCVENRYNDSLNFGLKDVCKELSAKHPAPRTTRLSEPDTDAPGTDDDGVPF